MMGERYSGYGGYGGDRGGSGGYEQRSAPVNVGDELEITIEAVGEKGDGLAKKDGFVLFVPNTKKGDRVRVRITRVLKKVGFAEVVSQAEGAAEEPASQEVQQEQPPKEPESPDSGSYEDTENFGEDNGGDNGDAE